MKKLFRELDIKQKIKNLANTDLSVGERQNCVVSLKHTRSKPEWAATIKTALILVDAKLDIIDGAKSILRHARDEKISQDMQENITAIEKQIQREIKGLERAFDVDWDSIPDK